MALAFMVKWTKRAICREAERVPPDVSIVADHIGYRVGAEVCGGGAEAPESQTGIGAARRAA